MIINQDNVLKKIEYEKSSLKNSVRMENLVFETGGNGSDGMGKLDNLDPGNSVSCKDTNYCLTNGRIFGTKKAKNDRRFGDNQTQRKYD